MTSRSAAGWLAILVVWAAVAIPLVSGARTLVFRDVSTTDLPRRAFAAAELAEGRIPAVDPGWGLGQPHRGNPTNLAYYPPKIAVGLLPFWTGFNLHYVGHWLFGVVGIWSLTRRLGVSVEGALLAAVAFGGGGWMLTCLSFVNLVVITAWCPWIAWGLATRTRAGTAFAALGFSMTLLGGEPFVALLAAPIGWIAARASAESTSSVREWSRAGLRVAAAATVGALLAAPQIVATLRILGFTVRRTLGAVASGAVEVYGFPWPRLAELVVPFPFGRPFSATSGYEAFGVLPGPPYVLTVHFGLVAFALAIVGVKRQPVWAIAAAVGLGLAVVASLSGDQLAAVTGGLARHPVKLAFVAAIAAPVLAGFGLDRARGSAMVIRSLLVAAGLVTGTGSTMLLFGALGGTIGWPLVVGGVALALSALALKSRAWLVPVIQLGALCVLHWGLVPTESTDRFRSPTKWLDETPPGTAVVSTAIRGHLFDGRPEYSLSAEALHELATIAAEGLDYSVGRYHGLEYPLAPDVDGMASPFSALVTSGLRQGDSELDGRWLRRLGVSRVVWPRDEPLPAGYRRIDRRGLFGVELDLAEWGGDLDFAWWPHQVEVVSSPASAFVAGGSFDPEDGRVFVSSPVDHTPGGELSIVEVSPDRIVLDLESPGGVVAVRRAWLPLYRATVGGRAVEPEPLDLVLMGVEVPAGDQRLEIWIPVWPEVTAVMFSVLVLVGLVAWSRRP